MTETKTVKVDNWGIFFLQRLKHFFNRTDYCDLTLQFQDNAQLKVHRLVLSACTEYFELLERTCEMYEDCLVMPDDLQADVVVPIVNFMYTGQLEFKIEILERLYQTAVVMNMHVLTKLLESHRTPQLREIPCHSYTNPKKSFKQFSSPSSSISKSKRSYSKAFPSTQSSDLNSLMLYGNSDPIEVQTAKKQVYLDPRPTRYELPEELESENLFENSFSNISYTSKPLMVHPETTKRYPSKRTGIFEDPSTSKRFIHGHSTMDIVECKKISVNENIFDDLTESLCDDTDTYRNVMPKNESRNSSQLFDQILDNGGPKVTIETKDTKQANNLDHAKIISEVLKKYPHLVKSNKNIKLKILNTPTKKKVASPNTVEKETKVKSQVDNIYSFESEVLDSKEAAKLIVLGAENVTGPWICLICGAPGKAIHFASYYKFRRHLVEVHNEKAIPNMCEYCGQKATKRNYMLHHLYSKHGVEPPPNVHFPKCNICNYIALTEGFLIKHKLSHVDNQAFRCNVCSASFPTSNQLLVHIQKTGHKYSDKRTSFQCIYCLKIFSRECNLYAHLRTYHKDSAKNDGVIDVSDEEKEELKEKEKLILKPSPKPQLVPYEVPVSFANEYDDADVQYQIQQQPDGNIQVLSKKPKVLLPAKKHKILNAGFVTTSSKKEESLKLPTNNSSNESDLVEGSNNLMDTETEEVVMIDENEYVVKDNHLILKQEQSAGRAGFSMPDLMTRDIEDPVHNMISTAVEFSDVETVNQGGNKMILKKQESINQPIQIVVSNEEEYKALMASNHSIIFEDGDAGKTLTVLTAPHNTNTIDLDNTQSNDMMIIQDNYPLNVSQTVSGQNSNIVVVYSHAIDDQNKQFQLNLGEQFVTSSGIITQNYETVTTSAAIMDTHIIETPLEDSWQNSIQQNIIPETEIEIPVSDNQVTIAPTGNEQSCINELEEKQLVSDSGKTEEVQQITENVINTTTKDSNSEEIIAHNINVADSVMNESQLGVSTTAEVQPVFTDVVNSVIETNLEVTDCNQTEGENYVNDELNMDILKGENHLQNAALENTIIEQEVEATTSPGKNVSDDQCTNTEGSADSETIENIAKEIQSSAAEPPVPMETEVQTSVDVNPINSAEVSTIKPNEQIKNLTSEWSDDEMENSNQEEIGSQEEVSPKNVAESEAMETDSQTDLEESIENIQHEMEKQLARSVASIPEKVDPSKEAGDSCSDDKTVDILKTESTKTMVICESNKTPDKISSLLNDWEDNEENECQEEIVTGSEVDENNTDKVQEFTEKESIPAEDIENTENKETVIETSNKPLAITDNEKIKSLVSDWVEEDEEEEVDSSK